MFSARLLKASTLQALLWALICVLSEWLLWSSPSEPVTELARAGLHASVGLTLAFTLGLLQRAGAGCALLTARPSLGLTPWLSFGLWGAWLGEELSQGDWVQAQAWAHWLTPCAALLFTIGGLCLALLHARRRSPVVIGLLLFAAALFQLVDLTALKSLYPAIHLSLYLLSGLLTLSALGGLIARASPWIDRFSKPLNLAPLALLWLCGSYAWLQLEGGLHLRSSLNQSTPRAALFPAWHNDDEGLTSLSEALKSLKGLNERALTTEQQTREGLSRLQSQGKAQPKHVILIIVDTLRYDGLYQPLLPAQASATRPPLATAEDLPFITEWRTRDAHVFLNAYTQAGRTKYSTPALFTSSEVSERKRPGGLHLAERLRRVGYQPLALTPEYFLWPVPDGASHLLKPFERSWHYTEDKQHKALEHWRSLLSQRDPERPLFAWVHLYMMHAPYFAGTKRLSRRDGSPEERYRMALKTLDQQLRELIKALEERGMLSDSVIALTSDHGEGLGDHGVDGHGSGVFEEQARTPFIIYDERLKSSPQRLHREVVGNVDLTPTLTSLVGLPLHEGDEGRSLVPLLTRGQEAPSWPFAYLIANGNASERGLVSQSRLKLTYFPRRAQLSLYDLEADPLEKQSVAGVKLDEVTQLSHALVTQLPQLALSRKVRRSKPERWAREREAALLEAEALISSSEPLSLELKRRLARLATHLKAPSLLKRLAERTRSCSVRAWLGVKALPLDSALGERLLKVCLTASERSGSSLSAQLMSLSAHQPRRFGQPWLGELLDAQDPELKDLALWRAWLTLSQRWPHQQSDDEHLLRLLKRAQESPSSSELLSALLLRLSAPELKRHLRSHQPLSQELNATLERLLVQGESVTQSYELMSAALTLIAQLAPQLPPSFRAQLRERCLDVIDRDPRAQLKKGAIKALSALARTSTARDEVTRALIERSRERLLVVPIIDALRRLPSAKTTSFLRLMRRKAKTGYARLSAKKALERIEGRSKTGKRRARRAKKGKRKRRARRAKKRKRSPKSAPRGSTSKKTAKRSTTKR